MLSRRQLILVSGKKTQKSLKGPWSRTIYFKDKNIEVTCDSPTYLKFIAPGVELVGLAFTNSLHLVIYIDWLLQSCCYVIHAVLL